MSLTNWFPLNGDLHNQGLNDTPLTMQSTPQISNEGKIGKCYKFTDVAQCLYASIYPGNLCPTSNFSWSIWYKCLGTGTQGAHQFIMSQGRDYGNAGAEVGFSIHLNEQGTQLSVYFGNLVATSVRISTPVVLNKWTHVATTVSSDTVSLFVDGEFISSTPLIPIVGTYSLVLGKMAYGYTGNTSHFGLNGMVNDARVYDHCLSKKEIHELYKCCVLHYDFNDPYLEPTSNLTTQTFGNGSGWAGHSVTITKVSVEGLPIEYADHTVVTYTDTAPGPGGGFHCGQSGMLTVTPNTTYTMSAYCRGSRLLAGSSDINALYHYEFDSTGARIFEQGVASKSRMEKLSNNWCRLWGTFTTQPTTVQLSLDFYQYPSCNCEYDVGGFQLEKKDHVTPFTFSSRCDNIVYDSSGYNNNGEMSPLTSPIMSTDTPLGKYCANMTGATITAPQVFFDNVNQCHTINAWIKTNAVSATDKVLLNFNQGYALAHSTTTKTLLYLNSGANDAYTYGDTITPNKWLMLTWVVNTFDQTCKVYYHYTDGTTFKASTVIPLQRVPKGFNPTTIIRDLDGQMADFKIYASALTEEEINNLYLSKVSVDKSGNMYANHLSEQKVNLVPKTTWGFVSEHKFSAQTIPYVATTRIPQYEGNGITSYAQQNCTVTWTDKGYRIYRPPNLTTATDGNTMWGGLVWQPLVTDRDILVQGRTYIIVYDVEGQSSKPFGNTYFGNLIGWCGGGLMPNPSNISQKSIPPNFKGKQTCYYKFTISDNLYKVCTETYASFVAGETYLSYFAFASVFYYESTGELGTDLTITSLRMYDVTEEENAGVTAQAILKGLGLLEQGDTGKIYKTGEVMTPSFYEV